ncbi:MAG: glycoside hydrolase/phage tail family protein, partial [Halocynthiibacter sp.]
GEYALATTPVHYSDGPGRNRTANVNSPSGKSDFVTSVEALGEELPNCGSTSLVVSWFGDDLRAPLCELRPKVEQSSADGFGMAWSVSGVPRAGAALVPTLAGRPVYGGTPTDRSVLEAINHLNSVEKDVVFYPFILMEQLDGNGLADPWSGMPDQPRLPWRGRITLSAAPGQPNSPDQSVAAAAEVASFFGAAQPGDFVQVYTSAPSSHGLDIVQPDAPVFDGISYSGPPEWSYRRFILHYAHLCAEAGGVSAFCIGSEMRGLTQIRGAGGSFPAVDALIQLAADVRAILGPGTQIGYAADWSEYFGYHPQDGSGDVYFHLDALWADANIDFIGIDNYMPLSDWREGDTHLDADFGSIYNLDYLKANIAGGEGFDWYYHSPEARAAQIRTDITDGAYGQPWVFRYKDLKSWWSQVHHNRVGGVQDANPTVWLAQSKPIWFTEFGCGAIDKGTNQPNKFLDPKSSESGAPRFSDGSRDELIQLQYLRAMFEFWSDAGNNPVSVEYGGAMVDMSRAHVWAWDTRPFPFFPNNVELWSDGDNYSRGHWLNGRTGARSLDSVVAEICARSGVSDIDVANLYGYLRGYTSDGGSDARAALQPLMLGFGFDATERDGRLIFRNRDGRAVALLEPEKLALTGDQLAGIERTRAPRAETAGRVRLNFVEADADYGVRAAEAIFPDEESVSVAQSELAIAFTNSEGRAVAERWLAESRVARDTARFALPPSALSIGAGDVVWLPNETQGALYRIDFVEQSGSQLVEAVRVEPGVYVPSDEVEDRPDVLPFTPAVPVFPVFMDLPLIAETNSPHAPYLAV